ncbi:MAG: hypothetical protein EXR66_02465 [Dehalococcoidia bacterium]|nr:hypothetical protein [Dehalococcoidia bacterium]
MLHAVPLAILLTLLGRLFGGNASNTPVILSSGLVALIEPGLQLLCGLSGQPFSWADVYTGPHVLAFTAVHLYVFRRYDFVALYSFRIIYYALWHVIWGVPATAVAVLTPPPAPHFWPRPSGSVRRLEGV